eukprot:5041594-Alexandrium_andersonii.AAC.1
MPAWAAAGTPLLPPNDPRASLAAGLAAGTLGVDVTAGGVAARAAAAQATGPSAALAALERAGQALDRAGHSAGALG